MNSKSTSKKIKLSQPKTISKVFSNKKNIDNDIKNKHINKGIKASKEVEPPVNWQTTYSTIKTFRANNLAPVDSMGCERAEEGVSPKEYRLRVLVSLILSSQTRDEITHQSLKNLIIFNQGELTAQKLGLMKVEDIDKCINKVGFHVKKSKYLQDLALKIIKDFNGDIPESLQDLLNLNGVGPKMAYLALQCAWGKNLGIGVDTHVHRISNRLNWVKSQTPEETRIQLQSWLPKEYWREINFLLVGFGQLICKATKPDCYNCPLYTTCPTSHKFVKDKVVKMEFSAKPMPKDISDDSTTLSSSDFDW